MIDAPTVLHDYLASQTALTALTSTRIWKERANAMPGYKPSEGKAIAFRQRSGTLDYSRAILHSSWQFKCYASDPGGAQLLYRTLANVLDEKPGAVVQALLELAGQTLVEDSTGFDYVLCFFETWMRA